MAEKMWAGRFQKSLDAGVNDFNSSIKFDSRMYQEDIKGSMAHATMLGAEGIIEPSEADAIVAGLEGILADLDAGKLAFDPTSEDIHMFVETVLTERIGDAGKRLHTARSRNDQVALDLRYYLKNQVPELKELLSNLTEVIITQAEAHKKTIMPGMTHLQHGQPVTFAHHILAYAQMFLRDLGRLSDLTKRLDVMPLGSGALAGTTYPIDREKVASALHFSAVTENSIDAVSDRDFVVELASCLSLVMVHISRFSEEIILWCSSEFNYIELDDAFATGSSIMPQKKNPDVAELCRGKAARVIGDLNTLLIMLKGIPLAYDKDMQEDKEAIFDALDNTKLALSTFAGMIESMTVHTDVLKAAAQKGYLNATDCADYLVKKGLPFRSAYKMTGELVHTAIEKGLPLEELSLADFQKVSPEFTEDIYAALDLTACVNGRATYGGPAESAVTNQIANLKKNLKTV
ncbi:MAG: argininosuccinate lyase [Streptococcaceae bacterium]|jgi:argininosuccinate lyase|nr:argininosuccinate lyase [Streptococcaceae bacterium]